MLEFPRLNRRTALAVGGGAATTALVACSSRVPSDNPSGSGNGPQRGGHLKLAIADASDIPLDPAVSKGKWAEISNFLIWDTLTSVDDTWTVKPSLATEWRLNEDATGWTFKLRKNVKFHDGKPFTSRDAAFTLKRVLDPALGSTGFGRISYSLDPDGISTPDDHSLVLDLKRPDSFLASALAYVYFCILPEGFDPAGDQPVGTGPFKLESWSSGQSFETVRNEEYWVPERPFLDRVSAVNIPEEFTKAQAVATGRAHFCDDVSPSTVTSLKGQSKAKVVTGTSATILSIDMDSKQEPFTDPRVTEAVKAVVDRQVIKKVVFGTNAEIVADVPVSKRSPFYPTQLDDPVPNIERARQLLAEAGYEDGIDLTLHTMPGSAGMVEQCVVVAQQAKAAGIRINVVQESPTTYFEKVWRVKPMFAGRWTVRHPYDLLVQGWQSDSSTNTSGFDSEVLDSALGRAASASTDDEIAAAMQDAMVEVSENAPVSIPTISDKFYVAASNLEGVDVSTRFRFDYFTNAYFA